MSFARYFKLSSYCLIASGFVAISATGTLDIFSLVLFATALVVSWFVDTARLRQRVPAWLLNSIALAYFPIYLLDYLFLSRSFVLSTVHLIFFMAAVKLVTRSTDRDYVYLYLISFAQLLAASTLTVDITFAISLFVFLVSGVSTLVLFEMRRSNARAQSQGKVQPLVIREGARGTGLELFSPFPAGSLSWTSLGMTLTTLVLAIPIFFLIPRISVGIGNRPRQTTQLVSGFSETVELGEIGTIKESDAIVMRVRLDRPLTKAPHNLKWRGLALDTYDGRAWSRSRTTRNRVSAQENYYKIEDSTQSADLLLQTFFREALSTDVVFAAHRVLAISPELGFLQRDLSGSLFTYRHPFKVRYTAVSEVLQPDPSLIPSVLPSIPDDIRATFLQVPPLDPRIQQMARDVTKEVTHAYGKAQALENYLKNNYGYSLELKGSPNSTDPLAMFLFDVRKGHCEYFASAMTIMLRQLAIPARLVNGFRAGEYNNLGQAWIVRQYDAHSWVEAYYPPYGWVEFDPTPPDPEHFRPAFLKVVSHLVDAMDLWWTEEVVNYTFWKQARLLSTARVQIVNMQRNLRELMRSWFNTARSRVDGLNIRSWFSFGGLAVALGLLLIGTLCYFFSRRKPGWSFRVLRLIRQRILLRNDATSAITGLYLEALSLLHSQGMVRRKEQTPLEFAQTLEKHPAATPLKSLTEIYNRIRFGSLETPKDLYQAESLLAALRAVLNPKKRKPAI